MTQSQFVKRIIALTVALIVVAPLSAVAAQWQWHRHIERDTRNSLIAHNAILDPIPWNRLLDSKVEPSMEWRTVSATGRFDNKAQKLWRKQPLNGEPGFIMITPFITDDGSVLLIARGWIAADGREPASSVTLSISDEHQEISARTRILPTDNSTDPTDLPTGQTNSPRTLLTSSTVDGLFELLSSNTSQHLTPIPLPELDSGPHVGYVGQWIIIGLSAVFVYITVLRRLRTEYQARETKSE
jgi:cytochrome oxidase assembly protein ShyY1